MPGQTVEAVYKIFSAIGAAGVVILGIIQLFKRPLLSRSQDSVNIAEAANKAVDAAIKGFEGRIKQLENELIETKRELEETKVELEKERLARQNMERANHEIMQKFLQAEARNRELSDEIDVLRARLDALKPRK